MPTAIPRYGVRMPPGLPDLIRTLDRDDALVEGAAIGEFERAIAARAGVPYAQSASYGRMAFAYLLRALDLPPGSEIVFPAFTFWVVPEMARRLGYVPVFADVDPGTGNLCPEAVARVLSLRTRAIVPTHLWGLPCDLDPILTLARRHGLAVIEDCAHALGATYRGQPVGSFGDAAFFSFQTLKPLNTFGGGMAVTANPAVAARVRALALAEPWPDAHQVRWQLWRGRAQQLMTRPRIFSATWYPLVRAASRRGRDLTTVLWERVRPLDELPADYRRRYSNAQAAIGLAALDHLDDWTARTRRHAQILDRLLEDVPGAVLPPRCGEQGHAYYQYSVGVRDRDAVVRACAADGIDVETLHVDVCTRVPLFGRSRPMPGADTVSRGVQVPVYESLTEADVQRVGKSLASAVNAVDRR